LKSFPRKSRYQRSDEEAIVHYRPAVIGEVVKQVIGSFKLEDQAWLAQLKADWPELVGPTVARHARPGKYLHETLYVFVDSAVWLSELKRYGQAQLETNIRQRFEKIKAVRLQPDPDR
jgi:predicted nucleic acid-binding Zn ribbon protein